MKVQYFKTTKRTNRFNLNQKVWLRKHYDNHLYIWFRHRGSNRYVRGIIDKFAAAVGEIKEIDVSEDFAKRVSGENSA